MTTQPPNRVADWLETARRRVADVALAPGAAEGGRVESVGDGIALVSGLADVRLNELMIFSGGQTGFASTLERKAIGCVLLDEITSSLDP